ncbi:uncharacterized protein PF11_0207-like isoform X2 [Sebastes umbrosus]|uniref:uncharacterized protein PF11_0207-like isoform X2 n=1 Tax=Sebastes umbrosus TaxID=72105 RepID=UPI00189EDD45|nr:uncharacterized protein PF11_0207-like isoform X2 [Sebastes umbrosus]
MTAFSGLTFLSQHGNSAQVAELQRAIRKYRRRLEEFRERRRRAEEEITQCEAETRRRVDFIMGKDAVVLSLMELGQVLQEERQLSEQLNGQASEDRNDLQERMEGITNKARSLAAEIGKVKEQLAEGKARNGKVKEQLAEGKARNMAAHALIQTLTGKSKTNPSE